MTLIGITSVAVKGGLRWQIFELAGDGTPTNTIAEGDSPDDAHMLASVDAELSNYLDGKATPEGFL